MSLKSFILFISLLLVISCLTPGVYFPKKNGVLYLTDDTLEEATKEYEYVLVSAFSLSCGTCLYTITPSFEELVKHLETKEPLLKGRVAVAKIIGYYNNKFMENYRIFGYPNVLLLKNMDKVALVPDRYKIDDLILFLRKEILRPIQPINDKTHFELLSNYTRYDSFITYYGNNKEILNYLKEVSEIEKKLVYTNVKNPELIKELNATEGQLSISKDFDEDRVIENSPDNKGWNKENILKFIDKYNHKVILPFEQSEGEKLLRKRVDTLLLITKKNPNINYYKDEELQNNRKNFYELAKRLRDVIQSSSILFDKEIINKKNKEDKKRKRRMGGFDVEHDPFGWNAQKKEREETEKRQHIFTSKLGINEDLKCEIKLLNLDKNLDEPVYYSLPCGKDNIDKNVEFIIDWKNGKIDENVDKNEIDTDYLIFEDKKNIN